MDISPARNRSPKRFLMSTMILWRLLQKVAAQLLEGVTLVIGDD